MKNIQPITIWKDGESKISTILKMYISYDNLESTATFQYELCDDQIKTLINGNINISGTDYLNWGGSGDSNEEAYFYGATLLNLTITGQYIPPTTDIEPTPEPTPEP
jgi:hypothetical protein